MFPGLHTLRTAAEYKEAQNAAREYLLRNATKGDLSLDEQSHYEALLLLLRDYQAKHNPVPRTSLIELVQFLMEQQGKRQADLVPLLGTRSRVSEFLSGKRGLTLQQARNLHLHLGVPAEMLLQPSGENLVA